MKFVAACFILMSAHAADAAEPLKLMMSGAGRASCAAWLSSRSNEVEGSSWFLGFWTGGNYALTAQGRHGTVGSSTDGPGLIGELKLRCSNRPAELLASEAGKMFDEFREQGK